MTRRITPAIKARGPAIADILAGIERPVAAHVEGHAEVSRAGLLAGSLRCVLFGAVEDPAEALAAGVARDGGGAVEAANVGVGDGHGEREHPSMKLVDEAGGEGVRGLARLGLGLAAAERGPERGEEADAEAGVGGLDADLEGA